MHLLPSEKKRSQDFYEQLERQYELYFEKETGVKAANRFQLLIGAYGDVGDNIIYADMITPDNIGHQVEITWRIKGACPDPDKFDKKNGEIKFDFKGIPFNEIRVFLKPNDKLPFKIRDYGFKFECYHFYEFKDITLKLSLYVKLDRRQEDAIESTIGSVIVNWNRKNKGTMDNTVDFVGKIKKRSDVNYDLFLDLGSADRKIIELILTELDRSEIGKIVEKVVVE